MSLRLLLAALPALLAAAACSGGGESLPFGLQSEVVVGANRPAALAFAPDGRLFFAEQYTGAIRIVSADGRLQEEPFARLPVSDYLGLDWGLTGLALHPDFEENHYVYAFYSVLTDQETLSRPTLVRLSEQDGVAVEETVIMDDFPRTDPERPGFNANGRIAFGPDGFLYLSIGDYDQAGPAQDISTPVGSLLRIDPEDGSAPADNPFADDPDADPRIFAYGFREPFPFIFHPATGAIYGTDNTPYTCEELNIIAAGGNYSWPDVGEFPFADCRAAGQTPAIHYFAREGMQPGDFLSFVEVSGLAFVSGDKYPALGDSLIVCESQRAVVNEQQSPGVLRRLTLAGENLDQVATSDILVKACRGDVQTAPDGTVYYSTDSEIRRLQPGSDQLPPPR